MDPRINYWLEVKDLQVDGTFTGTASVYGAEDLGGDIIEKGAFTKTISEHPIVPIFWQHDSSEVIGSGEVKEAGNKIILNGRLDLEDPLALKAYGKMKKKLIQGLSIGFQALKSSWQDVEENGANRMVRKIQELKLWEVSVVTLPMQPQAQVIRVKNADEYESRIARLEDELMALKAAKGTHPEPPKAPEPPPISAEPEVDHSLLESISQLLRA